MHLVITIITLIIDLLVCHNIRLIIFLSVLFQMNEHCSIYANVKWRNEMIRNLSCLIINVNDSSMTQSTMISHTVTTSTLMNHTMIMISHTVITPTMMNHTVTMISQTVTTPTMMNHTVTMISHTVTISVITAICSVTLCAAITIILCCIMLICRRKRKR